MITVRTFAEAREARTGTVALVPTMGFFHEGHLSLIEHAAARVDTTIVSLFVNPTQFGDRTDLETYPRDEERDAELALKAGADVLFAPSVEEVYPEGGDVMVRAGAPAIGMEGEHRPGHFDGVATVVAELFAALEPDLAVFGRKDAQQLAVVRSMAESLRFPVAIEGRPIIREHDGLALSSRNKRLTESDRDLAPIISRALFEAAALIETGERDAARIVHEARAVLAESDEVDVEYVAVADQKTARILESVETDCFVATAVRVGDTRLIDNVGVDAATLTVDRGVRLAEPSILYSEV